MITSTERLQSQIHSQQYDYKVFSIIVENRHKGINEHGVPKDKIQIMKDRFEINL